MCTKYEYCVCGNLVVAVGIPRFGLDNYALVDVHIWYVHFFIDINIESSRKLLLGR